MNSGRRRVERKNNFTKEKKLSKLIHEKSESDNESEHELSYYINDRVKLMKEVLKIIKSKKIRSMAPQFMRNMDNEEINSMLLEELLGISNKRLKYIFNGQNLEEDSSSTDPEDDQKPIDVISLDDISDDALEDIIDLDSDKESRRRHCRKHRPKIKEEPRRKRVKKEKQDKLDKDQSAKEKSDKEKDDNPVNEQNLMSVLELLELQARARAIRSQLALENSKKQERQKAKEKEETTQNNDDDDDVIIELPKNEEIVITSSDSENEDNKKRERKESNGDNFWKGQKPTNGSFYENSENNADEDLDTPQNNAKEDNTKQSPDKGQGIESNDSITTVSGGKRTVIIQQVEIIRPAVSSEIVDPNYPSNIPLPADEGNKMSSKKDGKNLDVDENKNLENDSKAGENVGCTNTNVNTEDEGKGKDQTGTVLSSENEEDVNVTDSSQTGYPQTNQSDNVVEKVRKSNPKQDCKIMADYSKKIEDNIDKNDEEKNKNTNNDGGWSENTGVIKKHDLLIDEGTKGKTKGQIKKNEVVVGTSEKEQKNIKLKGDHMEKINLKKAEETGEDKKIDSNKKDDLGNKKNPQEMIKSEDSKSAEESGEIQEKDARSHSKSESSDVSPKKTKRKCKRRMAALKGEQRTITDERTGDHSKLSEKKESSKRQKTYRKRVDDDKNNTDDSEGIELHYDQADIECIILD